mgnify:CR=1 FL=1|jgi:hypothetical protein
MQETLEQIDAALDDLDAMIMSLPLQDTVKRDLTTHLYTMWEQLEEAAELRGTHFE